ncbi:hypothetical protein A33M_2152 [Rhodovulum sp. PH10]|nr:hypothetical protein A33M_2152 [Rhodovulum sp. PH10]
MTWNGSREIISTLTKSAIRRTILRAFSTASPALPIAVHEQTRIARETMQ